MPRQPNEVKSSILGVAEYFSYPLMMFVATPFFLHFLGVEQYGQWMLLLTFTGIGGLGSIGMGAATTKEIATSRGRGDPAGVIEAIQASLMVSALSSVTMAMLMVTFGSLMGPFLFTKIGTDGLVRTIILVAAILTVIEQIDSVFVGALRGFERFDASAQAEVATKFILIATTLSAASITGDINFVFIAVISATLLRLIIKMLIVRQFIGQTPLPRWNKAQLKKVVSFGKWIWLQSLGSALFTTADRLLVGSLLGANALAGYSVCIQLAQQIQTIPAASAQFLFPTISRRRASGEAYSALAIKSSVAIGGIAILLSIPVAIYSVQILTAWVGPEIAQENSATLSILAIGFAVLGLSVGPHFILLGAGRARFLAIIGCFAGIVALCCTWYSIPYFGTIGASAGRLAYAAILCSLLWEVRRSLHGQESKR